MTRDRMINAAMMLTGGVTYGAMFPVNRAAAEAGWPPMAYAAYQSLIAGGVLAAIVLARGHVLVPTRRHPLSYVVIGSLAIALPYGILAMSAGHVPGSMLTLVMALSPVVTLGFAILIGQEVFRARALAAVALGFAGVVLIASPWSQALSERETPWFLLALAAPALFAASNISAIVLRPPATPSVTMAAGILIGGGLLALLPALALGPALWPSGPSAATLPPLLAASAINALVMVLFFEIVRRAGAAYFAMFNYIIIPAGVLWSIAAFGETLPRAFFAAFGLMAGGIYISLGGKAPPPPRGATSAT